MNVQNFQRIAELFDAARQHEPDARRAFLDNACGGDPSLREQVESLLSHHDDSRGMLDSPVISPTFDLERLAATTAAPTAASGDKIGQYRLVRLLGEGGMGAVYLAEQEHPRRLVAVKLLKAGTTSQQMLRRFGHEIEILGRLQHPGIAQIHEAGTIEIGPERRQPFYAMEYVDGESLTGFANSAALTPRQRLDLMIRICEAVQYAHQKGVIHRDLKPGNILVVAEVTRHGGQAPRPAAAGRLRDEATKGPVRKQSAIRDPQPLTRDERYRVQERQGRVACQGQSAIPKILDFGVARLTDADVQMTTLQTGVGQLVGTLAYMSPEQVAGDPRELDTRSDVYSLGVILYELLTGRLPIEVKGRGVPEAVRAIRQDEPSRISSIGRHLRGDLETIVHKALAKDRERRYQSASDLGADLRRYLNDEPIEAKRDSSLYVLRKAVRRHRTIASAIALLFLVVLTSTAVLSFMYRRQGKLLDEVSLERDRALRAEKTAGLERDRALRAEKTADRRFGQVRKLANTFLFEVPSRIEHLTGATPAREFLVTTALEYLDSLAQEAGDDPSLLRELAAAYERVGQLQGNLYTPNMGYVSAARGSYEKSLAILDRVIQTSPNDVETQRRRAMVQIGAGDVQALLGRSPDALASYEQGLAALSTLAAGSPTNAEMQRDLAFAHLRTGLARTSLGQLDKAMEDQQRSLDLRRALVAAHPDNLKDRASLAISYIQTGELAVPMGQPQRALEEFKESLSIREALMQFEPDNVEHQRGVAATSERIGDIQGNPRTPGSLGDAAAALASYQRSMDIQRSLAQTDPRDARAQRDLSCSFEKMGDVYGATGRNEDALAQYEESLKIRQRLAERDPENADAQRDLVIISTRIGDAHAQLGHVEEASESYAAALSRLESRAKADPANADLQRSMGVCLYKLGAFHSAVAAMPEKAPEEQAAQWAQARSWLQRSLDVFTGMRDRGLLRPADSHIPGQIEAEIGRCTQAINERTGGE